MTNRKTPPKRDGRSQPQTYVIGCERVDEERVVEWLVWLLKRRKRAASAPTTPQIEPDAVDDAAD